MAADSLAITPLLPGAEPMLAAMTGVRERTLASVSHLSDDDLTAVHFAIMSPLAWDLGHITTYEDLWIAHRLGGIMPLLHAEGASLYLAFETPRAVRGEIEALDPASSARLPARGARAHLAAARRPRRARPHDLARWCSARLPEHCETMRQTLCDRPSAARRGEPPSRPSSVRSPAGCACTAGPFTMGAAEDASSRFSYDNERPQHEGAGGARYEIARVPVSNASWMRFSEGGGYVRREWWSDEGWAWKEAVRHSTRHRDVRAHSATPRRPAATSPRSRPTPSPPRTTRACPPRLSGRRRRPGTQGGSTPHWAEVRDGVWGVDELHFLQRLPRLPRRNPTASTPEVFFGESYRVLRGSSWATDQRVASPTFRNWDLPQRQQIFAGVRLREGPSVERPLPGRRYSPGPDSHRIPSRRARRGPFACRGRPRRPHATVQGAASQALLRLARRRAVRPHLRAPRVLPDARRALDPRAARRGDRRAHRRQRARRARLRHRGQNARAARRPAGPPARSSATCRSTSPRAWCARLRRDADRESTRASACTGSSAISSATSSARTERMAGPAPRRLPRRHHRQLPARQPPARAARDGAAARP